MTTLQLKITIFSGDHQLYSILVFNSDEHTSEIPLYAPTLEDAQLQCTKLQAFLKTITRGEVLYREDPIRVVVHNIHIL